ncbi:hypothetical protein E3N88_38714 [Mikania micrantha]|uniref:Uncharacterized protein n=1 Tax=Mikania micrantha TaxID=192012 RepID=A0A5N6LUU4_9ASTR|nr:hypothetical protein E3N88_38714 [Mikania micrantha]
MSRSLLGLPRSHFWAGRDPNWNPHWRRISVLGDRKGELLLHVRNSGILATMTPQEAAGSNIVGLIVLRFNLFAWGGIALTMVTFRWGLVDQFTEGGPSRKGNKEKAKM